MKTPFNDFVVPPDIVDVMSRLAELDIHADHVPYDGVIKLAPGMCFYEVLWDALPDLVTSVLVTSDSLTFAVYQDVSDIAFGPFIHVHIRSDPQVGEL